MFQRRTVALRVFGILALTSLGACAREESGSSMKTLDELVTGSGAPQSCAENRAQLLEADELARIEGDDGRFARAASAVPPTVRDQLWRSIAAVRVVDAAMMERACGARVAVCDRKAGESLEVFLLDGKQASQAVKLFAMAWAIQLQNRKVDLAPLAEALIADAETNGRLADPAARANLEREVADPVTFQRLVAVHAFESKHCSTDTRQRMLDAYPLTALALAHVETEGRAHGFNLVFLDQLLRGFTTAMLIPFGYGWLWR